MQRAFPVLQLLLKSFVYYVSNIFLKYFPLLPLLPLLALLPSLALPGWPSLARRRLSLVITLAAN